LFQLDQFAYEVDLTQRSWRAQDHFLKLQLPANGAAVGRENTSAALSDGASQPPDRFERRGNNLKRVEDFHLKVEARIWP